MDCPHCNAEVAENDRFCSQCGVALAGDAPISRRRAVKLYAGEVVREGQSAASEGVGLLKKGLQTETGKSVASCAVLGAAAGSIVPFVGTAMGATIGAALGLIRKI